MKSIRFEVYHKLLNKILAWWGNYGRNIIMRRQEHIEFFKACRVYGNSQNLQSLFRDMGIKKIVILWNLRDNLVLWLRTISLMKRNEMPISIIWNVRWRNKQKVRSSLSTIYLYDKKGEPYDPATGEAFKLNDPYDLKSAGSCLCIRQLLLLMNIGANYKKERLRSVLENLPHYFQSIAVLGNNRLARYTRDILLKAGANIRQIQISNAHCNQLVIKEKSEIVLNMTFVPFKITHHGKSVYVMSVFGILTKTPEVSTDIDIAEQVIPQLIKNGIKVVTVSLPCWPDEKMTQANMIKDAIVKRKYLISKGLLSRRELLPFSEQFCRESKEMRYLSAKGYITLTDQKGKLINVIHGMRYTCGNQDNATHRIMMFGPCILYGRHVADEYTIPSMIRKCVGKFYNIENHGSNFWNMNLQVRAEHYHTGDIVIIFVRDICAPYYIERHIPVLDLSVGIDSVSRLENHFTDYLLHCDHIVNQRISETILEYLNANHILDNAFPVNHHSDMLSFGNITNRNSYTKYAHNKELNDWLNRIRHYRHENGRIGAIVMNCNPFTLGHRYLLEKACEQADSLIIFVVEEDKSFFQFKDRIAMVRLGTEDLKKVTVIPSGKYIISAQTLPGYFEKDDNPNIVFDATDDLDLFAEVIAPKLNIHVRFVGEEPIDAYTRQYNQAMSKVLPEHGIEFIEIPRREHNGSVISASRVRNLMAEKRYEEIKELVMPKVYAYLEEHYF